MEPQPLTFTTHGRGTIPSQLTPVQVDIHNWDQLGTLPLDELCLSGTIDLSTSEQVINFNAWLGMTSYRLGRGEQQRDTPRGKFSAELSDECAVTITASLTCELDFNRLAREIMRLIKPMHA